MFEQEDEKVNGPKIAADILKKMTTAQKAKIVEAIEIKSPNLAKKITESLFSFEDIKELTPQGVQILIKEIDHNDLVMSFKLASPEIQNIFLKNMSERKKSMLQSDFETLPPVKKLEVEDAQKRILARLDELRTQGIIRTQSPNELWV